MNAIRITALSVLLAATVVLAAEKKRPPKPPPPPPPAAPIFTAANKPKTCSDQCAMLEKLMTDPCNKPERTNKLAQEHCLKQAKKMSDTCEGSCKEKGRIDKQYMLERMKPPAGYKAAQAAEKSGSTQSGGDDHDVH